MYSFKCKIYIIKLFSAFIDTQTLLLYTENLEEMAAWEMCNKIIKRIADICHLDAFGNKVFRKNLENTRCSFGST